MTSKIEASLHRLPTGGRSRRDRHRGGFVGTPDLLPHEVPIAPDSIADEPESEETVNPNITDPTMPNLG